MKFQSQNFFYFFKQKYFLCLLKRIDHPKKKFLIFTHKKNSRLFKRINHLAYSPGSPKRFHTSVWKNFVLKEKISYTFPKKTLFCSYTCLKNYWLILSWKKFMCFISEVFWIWLCYPLFLFWRIFIFPYFANTFSILH